MNKLCVFFLLISTFDLLIANKLNENMLNSNLQFSYHFNQNNALINERDASDLDFSKSKFYIIAGTLFISSWFFDQEIRDFTQREIYGGDNFFTQILHGVGDRNNVFYGALVVYSANTIIQNNYMHETLMLSLQSLIMTQGVTEGFKKTFKRARPRHSPTDPFDFWDKGESFFSGHSSGAWSYLTVVAERHPELKWLAYGFASCVSMSRIYEDAHWASDVILGAIVGYGIGHLTLRMNIKYTTNFNILPYIDEDGGKYVLVQWGF
ncbi:MAG: phosphatase PAP2 family protein [Candidatus Cloacimonetes bacterium]|nr:phosphatase PAP2 family protein [Candidatus Cloacimonadota bacterium]